MVRCDGAIKVLDFGLAKLDKPQATAPDASAAGESGTVPGLLMGTVRYMSPEQVRGFTVDARTDIWSLGILLYEMTSGHRPFEGPTDSDVIAAILEREPLPLGRYSADVPEALERIVTKALTKVREERYQAANDLLADLGRLKEDLELVPAADRPAPSPAALHSPRFEKRVVVATLALVLLMTALTAIGYGLHGALQSRPAGAPQAGPGPVESAIALKTTQVTTSSGLDFYPAFSPDGNAIAYSSERRGSFEIYVKQLAPGGGEIQITSDGQQSVEPAWSPDGRLLAYHSKERRGIWLVPALGGTARRLTDFGSRPAWSPDGSQIAFQSDGLSILRPLGRSAMPPSTIWLTAIRGGVPSQLTRAGHPEGGHGAPAWSPDGKRIVFAAHDRDSELWTVEVSSRTLVRVLSTEACCGWMFDPVYAPDGRSIYFAGFAHSEPGLWKVAVSPVGIAAGKPEAIMQAGATFFRHLSFAPDGRRLAYSVQSIVSSLRSVPVSSSGEPTGAPSALTEDTTYVKDVSFSPDGHTLAYSNITLGAGRELWVADANGTHPRQVLATGFQRPIGWFGREANKLALFYRRPEGLDVRTLTLDDGRERRVTSLWPDANDVRVSPDATRVVFNSKRSGTINLWMQAFAGGEPRQLTFDKESMGFARWSPDGRLLAFQMKRGDDDHLAIMPSEGGPCTQLTFERGRSAPRSWSPDGDKILFAGTRDNMANLWWVSRATKVQRQVTSYQKLNVSVEAASWSPLGDRIVYEYAEIKGNVWTLQLR
jgi:Tol biopolymer transport system component